MRHIIHTIALLSVLTLTSGCTKQVRMSELFQTKEVRAGLSLRNTHQVAQSDARLFIGRVEERLTKAGLFEGLGREKEVKLKVITREKIQELSDELRLQEASGVINQDQLLKIGRFGGLHVMVVVEPVKVSKELTRYVDGKDLCVTRKLFASMQATALSVETAEVILTGVYEGEDEDSVCNKSDYRVDKLKSEDKMATRAVDEAAEDFADDFKARL